MTATRTPRRNCRSRDVERTRNLPRPDRRCGSSQASDLREDRAPDEAGAGVEEFILWAKARFRIALATSATARNREAALKTLGLGNPFEAIVDASRSHRPKPDPEVFQIAIRDLHVKPQECWVIEDSTNGLRAAKAAQRFAVGLTTTFDSETLRQAGADTIVGSFVDLRQALLSFQPH